MSNGDPEIPKSEPPYWLRVGDESWGTTDTRRRKPRPLRRQLLPAHLPFKSSGNKVSFGGVLLLSSNLLVINQYFVQLDRNGAAGTFTDAVSSLSNALPQAASNSVYVADWGMYETLEFLHQGRLALHYSPALLVSEHADARQLRAITAMIADPNGLIVNHVAEREIVRRAKRMVSAGFYGPAPGLQ